MRVQVVANVWLDDRAAICGEVVELPESDAERLVIRGVAVPVSEPKEEPRVEPKADVEPEKPKKKRAKR